MSKDEYLITDAPLKALTVFAMPMILGSFFRNVAIKTLREATSFSEHRPQICWVI